MDTLLYLISYAVGLYLIYLCMNIFYANKKRNKYIEFALYALLYITSSTLYLVFNNTIYNIVSNIMLMVMIAIYCNIHTLSFKNVLGAIGVALACYVTVGLVEVIAVTVSDNYVPALEHGMLFSEFSQPIYYYLILFFLYFMLIFTLRFFVNIKYTDGLGIKYKIPPIIIPSITFYIVILLLVTAQLNGTIMTITIVLMLILNLVFFWIYNAIGKYHKENADKVIIQKENEVYLKQMEFTKSHQIKTAKIKHDIDNHLTTVREHIKNGHIVEAERYIQDIIKQTEEIKTLSKSGNMLVDTVMNDILTQCKANDINVEFNENIPKKFNKIADVDLNSLLYNLLNNAITATCKLPCDEREIDIKILYDRNVLTIKVQNTYDGVVEKDKNDNLISSKKDKTIHGYGIKNISHIVNKYDGRTTIDYDNETFCFISLLYDSSK